MSPSSQHEHTRENQNQTAEQVNYFEERCKELQEEIDDLRGMLGETDENGVLNKYIAQLKEKDALLKERDSKLEDLADKNNLLTEEKLELKKQLARLERRATSAAGLQSQITRSRNAPDSFTAGAASAS